MNGLLVIITAFLAINCAQEKDWILYTMKVKIGHCQTQNPIWLEIPYKTACERMRPHQKSHERFESDAVLEAGRQF